jgi:hypothetical protein
MWCSTSSLIWSSCQMRDQLLRVRPGGPRGRMRRVRSSNGDSAFSSGAMVSANFSANSVLDAGPAVRAARACFAQRWRSMAATAAWPSWHGAHALMLFEQAMLQSLPTFRRRISSGSAQALEHQGDGDHDEGEEDDQVAVREQGSPSGSVSWQGQRGGQRDDAAHAAPAHDEDLVALDFGSSWLLLCGPLQQARQVHGGRIDPREAHDDGHGADQQAPATISCSRGSIGEPVHWTCDSCRPMRMKTRLLSRNTRRFHTERAMMRVSAETICGEIAAAHQSRRRPRPARPRGAGSRPAM